MSMPKILYFVNGPAPKAEDVIKASKIAAKVVFRNALAVTEDSSLEECDGVIGDVPEVYAKAFKSFEVAEKEAALSVISKIAAIDEQVAPGSKAEEQLAVAEQVVKKFDEVADVAAPVKKTRARKASWKPNVE